MKSQNLAIVFGALALTTGAAYAGGKTPLATRTPAEQQNAFGHGMVYASAAMDELGDRVSHYGRYGFLKECFDHLWEQNATEGALRWAICGDDVKKLDIAALKESVSEYEYKNTVLMWVDRWKAIGAKIEAEAKTDKGIAQILKLRDDAQAEWKDVLAKNQASFDLYVKLYEASASGKTNEPAFQGCWEATQPAFAKLVKATKFTWENAGSETEKLRARMDEMLTSTENYLTAASFSMCATSVDPSGEALADAALSARGGQVRVGWRTLLITKALAPSVNPKFADRALSWSTMLNGMTDRMYLGDVAINSVADRTPTYGEIKKLVTNGDETTIQFKGDKVEACLKWVETNKVTGYATNGDPMHERICKKRGMVDNQEEDVVIPTRFAAGLAPGVNVTMAGSVVVEAWKGKKFVAIFGVPVK